MPVRVSRLPRDMVETPSQESFQIHLDIVNLGNDVADPASAKELADLQKSLPTPTTLIL